MEAPSDSDLNLTFTDTLTSFKRLRRLAMSWSALSCFSRSMARTRQSWYAPVVATLMLGAMLATSAMSLGLLPFVAAESDFRVTRRVHGATDADVFGSYGFAQRYQIYDELRRRYPSAELMLFGEAPASSGNMRMNLVAYGGAGIVCDAGERIGAEVNLGEARALIDHLELNEALESWEGGDSRAEVVHRIFATQKSTRFLVLSTVHSVDIVGLDLLRELGDLRCDDRG